MSGALALVPKYPAGPTTIARREERRALLRKLKAVPCADCGGRFPSFVMEFDHVRGIKVQEVGQMYMYRLDRLLAEVEKCDVVCSNCHQVRTYQRGAHFRSGGDL